MGRDEKQAVRKADWNSRNFETNRGPKTERGKSYSAVGLISLACPCYFTLDKSDTSINYLTREKRVCSDFCIFGRPHVQIATEFVNITTSLP